MQPRFRLFSSSDFPRSYVKFLFGLFITRLGDSLYTFAIPWISFHLTGSVMVMGSLFVISVVPVVVFGPFIGVAVDRWDKRTIMLAADIIRMFLVCLVPLLQMIGTLQLWHLYVIGFILAVMTLFFDVAAVTAIPYMVKTNLTAANARYQFVNQIADLIGPALAGGIIAAIGGFHALWLDGLSFLATLIFVFQYPKIKRANIKEKKTSFFAEMGLGFNWLIKDKLNLSLSLQAMAGNFGASALLAILMFYLLSTLHLSEEQSGLNYAMIGIGGLIGSIIIVPLERRYRRGKLIPLLLGMGSAGLLIVLISDFWLIPGMAFGIAFICNVAWNSIVMTVRQETVPAELLGKVLAFSRVFTRLAMPLGALAGMALAEINPVYVFLLASAAKAVEVLIALISPIRKL
ncbi:MFS transporter [Bacillus sp. M6-12]|uniref:MFS transporter n=1 Tax=Bacillus sp. M6-12 TaxID=2054166 RepID=UPI0035B53556